MINLIIAAAGNGSRFSSDIPKQFVRILGKEILEINLQKWVNIKLIDKIYLVLPKMEFEYNKKKYKKFSNKIIPIIGGDSRAESINNAIKVMADNPLTLIHDGARPFFSVELLNRVLEGLKNNKAIIPAIKINDAIKSINGNQIVKTVNRENLIAVQTPQGFTTSVIKRAYQNIDFKNTNFDDSELVENIGVKVFFVDGDKNNIKITTKDDLEYCKFLIEKGF
jgi:2-C-methyl-D-erythritol 4-phosphate cytidylyltransferase